MVTPYRVGDFSHVAELKSSQQSQMQSLGTGAYVGVVVDHLDSEKVGRLRVQITTGARSGESASDSVQTTVDYAPPFFGSTPYSAMDANNRDSASSQSSYGMWFIPPDVGARVLCFFVEGHQDAGFWVACVPEPGVNHMVPGIAASKYAELTPQEKQRLGTDEVPVLEINRRLKGQRTDDIDKRKRPMHPFALRLAEQGLLKDPIRGITTSSARREVPSMVFGISTPGPPKVGGKKYKVGPDNAKFEVYAEREGGTQFVMDDGVIGKDEKTGKPGIKDELVRIRTRTGHQILLHNSADLIYICNSKGTAWIEMTSSGKIDIFAQDSVSIHSEQDFNFRADRNVNIEAGNNVHLVATRGTLHLEAGGPIEGFAGLDVNWTAKGSFNASVAKRIRLTANGTSVQGLVNSGIDIFTTLGNINIYATKDIKMQSLLACNVRSGTGMNILSGAATTIKSVGATSVLSGLANYITAAAGSNVFSSTGPHIERASLIDMNGPTPAPVDATLAKTLELALDALALLPEIATATSSLDTFELPSRGADANAGSGDQKGWENNNYFRQPNIKSIMKRVPMHEPWDHHETVSPDDFKPIKTDRDDSTIV